MTIFSNNEIFDIIKKINVVTQTPLPDTPLSSDPSAAQTPPLQVHVPPALPDTKRSHNPPSVLPAGEYGSQRR